MKKFSPLVCVSLALLVVLFGVTACQVPSSEPLKTAPEKLNLQQASFADLPGWKSDQQGEGLTALQKSCVRILKKPATSAFYDAPWSGTYADWQAPCLALEENFDTVSKNPQSFFEEWFEPYTILNTDKPDGLFTGYYEPFLKADDHPSEQYPIPLRARPDDLVMVNLGEFRAELKGQRIAGRVVEGMLKPYEDRAAIEDQKLPPAVDKPLFWAADPVDVFFLQIQGSGVVVLPDGKQYRLGYDGQNGHPYTAIGKELVTRGVLTKETASMQTIRQWLLENPVEGRELMRTNKSYVFFKVLDTGGPVGAEGVVLTPRRSLAVDHKFIPYGVPLYLHASHPDPQKPDLQQLMIAQDTGGAIQGVVRGDMFWGFGEEAAHYAGIMKSPGRFWILLPKTVKLPQ